MYANKIIYLILACLVSVVLRPSLVAAQNTAPRVSPTNEQSWLVQEAAFFKLVQSARSGDPEAQKKFDEYLTEYEKHPLARTPMENLDVLGVVYAPRDGVEKCLPVIVMNVALGWFDALRFGSESGREEISSNRHFFKRAFILGGDNTYKQVFDFFRNTRIKCANW